MNRTQALDFIFKHKVVAILRGIAPELTPPLAEAISKGGVRCIEITYDQSGGKEKQAETPRSIAAAREKLGDGVLFGAGTVLTVSQVEDAVKAGADFILSPDMNPAVIARTRELGAVSVPGAFTPTEIVAAWNLGADIVKLFPATLGGAGYIKALKGPLPHIPLSAVGGVNPENAKEFLRAGACGLGVGGGLADAKLAASGDWDRITRTARIYTEAVAD